MTAKRRTDANVATTANVMASDVRAGANVAVTANQQNGQQYKGARANVPTTADANVMAERRTDASEPVTNEELEMIVRELVIYGDNKRSIGLTKSFEKPAQNKYSLQARPAITIESQIYTSKRAIVPVEQPY